MATVGTHHAADSEIWMSVGEAAKECGLSEETVRRRILSGKIPVRAFHDGRTTRIDRSAWRDWFTGCLVNADKEPA